MILSGNVIRNSLFRVLSYDPVFSIINKCSLQTVNVHQPSIGYLISCNEKYSSLRTSKYKLIARFSSNDSAGYSTTQELTAVQFEKVSNDTLESLTEYFDELVERAIHLTDGDVSYGDGVLTIKFGNPYGTYVINRQTPNKQIWLSSPKSGPKRYDFVNGKWIYKHDGKTMHELLNNEIPAIVRDQTQFEKCSYSGKEKDAAMRTT
ncbi:frataxin homolog, mitochondrial [Ceratina calcarata]|uniref:ferroxidase n=1 Tax=Ceratina calcarata TaxID=156304 RepID=A0AAJ7JHQ7_9HYME|nr:frataxin homolog, mitochondrial [Ceratina calcarata]